MANSKGPSTMTSVMYNGKYSLLPPKSPFPSIAPSYADSVSNSAIGPKEQPKYRNVNFNHQRTSSESFLIEEQPSWLDDLLNEPESPVRRGHRRSSSDSFTYMEAANAAYNEYQAQNENRLKNLTSAPSWGSQEFALYKDFRNPSFFVDPNTMIKNRNRAWGSSQNALSHSISSVPSREADGNTSIASEKKEAAEFAWQDVDTSERKDYSSNKAYASETDTKRAKQQFAQRSRVRKLQYIAELEKNVQALQAEGSEVSAEVDFLNRQSLILGMENNALKQRLDNLAQEQLIKYMEHEVLEREIGRLRALYQQQQQQQQQQPQPQPHPHPHPHQPPPIHRRIASKDKLDAQFSNLSLKKDSDSTRDVSGPINI